ncbi:Clp protease N-terminal domain-containing protein [Kitasatospora viridis]|uniref:ATP-dependent Clp protease ATP-binding subunit ClpC n=1 Tax=Kitasatospora viridis TaxID=281105 RepID=A0A561SFU3_9ACTN|nr:Clp protease N-terminal domain-containing protein [Kitasatospora viridis]TWF73744.1 ATP-dependent Clp protease ATP-binding subunit ClpC [Kitasatospora viridis]
MPKINVYLPDDLAEAVRAADISVSPICQRALEHAVRQVTAVRAAAAHDLNGSDLALVRFTAKARTAVGLAVEQAREAGEATVSTARLLAGLVAEGDNLALQVLRALEIAPEQLTALAPAEEPGPVAEGALHFSIPAGRALELTVAEATQLGHNYVGTEHLLLGLIADPDGTAGRHLRDAGADQRIARRAVAAALAGYGYLQAAQPATNPDRLAALLQQQLQPLIARIEQLEARLA